MRDGCAPYLGQSFPLLRLPPMMIIACASPAL